MKALFRTVPLLCMMAVIFVLSNQPGDTLPLPSFAGADKVAHFLAYAFLAAAALSAFTFFLQDRLKPGSIGLIIVTFCILYGISDEFHQSFIPFRDVSAVDVIADGSGSICIVLFWLLTGHAKSTSSK